MCGVVGGEVPLRLVPYNAVNWEIGRRYCRPMEPETSNECPLHGAGVSAHCLVGRRLAEVVGSWHLYGSDSPAGPLDVWLIDDRGAAIHLTTGSDWCLIVEASKPHAGYDMGDSGRVMVGAIGEETPFADHVGEDVLAVREEHAPNTGRVALELGSRPPAPTSASKTGASPTSKPASPALLARGEVRTGQSPRVTPRRRHLGQRPLRRKQGEWSLVSPAE